jgi:hypothetical protein
MSLSHLNKLLIDIKVISRIEENGKICTVGSNVTLDKSNVTQWLRRFLSGDSKYRTVDAIENIVSAVIEISIQLMNSNYLQGHKGNSEPTPEKYYKTEREKICLALRNVSRDLSASLKGIRNLSKTYGSDAVICARLEQIVETIETHVSRVDIKLASIDQDEKLPSHEQKQ